MIRVGYPARNLSIGCTTAHTFRLASYSEARLLETLARNLDCLIATLHFNLEHDLRFFRIGSDLIPFGSHPVQTADWQTPFTTQWDTIAALIHDHQMRISMHPGQFTLVNTPNDALFAATTAELVHHVRLLERLNLDPRHKIQIHVGGIYGDKAASLERFAARWETLPASVKARLVIENDDRLFSVADCRWLHTRIETPIIFDNLHHELLSSGETVAEGFTLAYATWRDADGVPMMDYSQQDMTDKARAGKHAAHLDAAAFAAFIASIGAPEVDIMLEMKDKEGSALAARAALGA